MPYWFDRRGINFGDIDTSFKINRTQLSNLNIFRKNDIRGFITAKGELKGKITNPDISINFNVDYPHFKGIRIRETWEGDIKNENNEVVFIDKEDKVELTDDLNNARKKRRRSSASIE